MLLAEALSEGKRPPSSVVNWYIEEHDRFMRSSHLAKDYYLGLRDDAYREALSSCDGKYKKQRIGNAHEHIESFEKLYWPGHKHLSEPPKQWSNLRKQLFFYFMYAKKSGSRTSLSDRQYYEIAGPVGRSKKKEQLTISERINHQVIKNAAT